MQQSTQVKQRNNNIHPTLNRQKVKKIKRFGKVIKGFCKELGVDKQTFFKALGVEVVPAGRHVAAQIEDQSMYIAGGSKVNSSNVVSTKNGFDTGKAALIAYTNLDQLNLTEDLDTWNKSPKTRNNFIPQKTPDVNNAMAKEV